jgi:hypothetical protein
VVNESQEVPLPIGRYEPDIITEFSAQGKIPRDVPRTIESRFIKRDVTA